MKKIIAVVTAAMVAASAFAVDFTGGIKITGSLFEMKFAEKEKPNFLKMGGLDSGGWYWGTRLQAGVSADKAGAEIVMLAGGKGGSWDTYKLWIQPIDALKINFGNKLSYKVYSGSEWWQVITGTGEFVGIGLDVAPISGLDINLALKTDGGYWTTAADIGNKKIGTTSLFAKYTADFGGVGAGVLYEKSDLKFAAGYSGSFAPIELAVDATIKLYKDNVRDLAFDAFVKFAQDALELKFYAMYQNSLDSTQEALAANTLNAWLRFQYAINAFKIYCEVGGNGKDYINDSFNTVVYPGVQFNVGSAALDIGIQVTLDKPASKDMTVSMTVPVYASLSF